MLLVLLAAIGVVLLVLCVNVANLLLARGIAREREMMTRAALGAGRTKLARQVIVENLTIAFGSGVLGVFLAMASLRIVTRLLPSDLPRIEQVALDARVLLFALGVSLVRLACSLPSEQHGLVADCSRAPPASSPIAASDGCRVLWPRSNSPSP